MDKNGNAKKVKYEIDVVAHSMGFAYAQGFIEQANTFGLNIDWSGYYIIAPENGNAGSINNADAWDEKFQYGSNLGIGGNQEDKKWLQDGVAPQFSVDNIGINNRIFIPNTSNGKNVPKDYFNSHKIANYWWIFERPIGTIGYVSQK